MKKPIFALLLALMLLLAACAAPEQAPETSPAPVPESPSSVTEPAPESEPEPASEPEPVPEPEPEPESSQPEEPASASSTPQQNPDISRRNPDTTFPPDQQPPVTTPVDPQAAMCDYLEANLTDEEYTSIYWRDEGLGVLTPNVERVKEVAAAYDGPAVDMEVYEIGHSFLFLSCRSSGVGVDDGGIRPGHIHHKAVPVAAGIQKLPEGWVHLVDGNVDHPGGRAVL